MIKSPKENIFVYDKLPEYFKQTLLLQFTVPLDNFSDVQDIEQKILPEIYKNQKFDRYIKVPIIPLKKPPQHEYAYMSLDDENLWLFELHADFEELFTNAVNPLYDYMKTFDEYTDVLGIDPDAEIKILDVDDIDH